MMKSARQDVLELLSPTKQRELKRSKPGIWSRLVGAVKGMGQAILGGGQDQAILGYPGQERLVE